MFDPRWLFKSFPLSPAFEAEGVVPVNLVIDWINATGCNTGASMLITFSPDEEKNRRGITIYEAMQHMHQHKGFRDFLTREQGAVVICRCQLPTKEDAEKDAKDAQLKMLLAISEPVGGIN